MGDASESRRGEGQEGRGIAGRAAKREMPSGRVTRRAAMAPGEHEDGFATAVGSTTSGGDRGARGGSRNGGRGARGGSRNGGRVGRGGEAAIGELDARASRDGTRGARGQIRDDGDRGARGAETDRKFEEGATTAPGKVEEGDSDRGARQGRPRSTRRGGDDGAPWRRRRLEDVKMAKCWRSGARGTL